MLQNLLNLPGRVRDPPGRMLTAISDLLPGAGLQCGTENQHLICTPYRQQFFDGDAHRCRICAPPPSQPDVRCGGCLAHPPAFDRTIVACDYKTPLDQLVLSLKFERRLAVAHA